MLPKVSSKLFETPSLQKVRKASRHGLLIFSAILIVSPLTMADWKDSVGYTELVNKLGSSTPNGAGVPISQVEALVTIVDDADTPEEEDDVVVVRSYKPDPSSLQFTSDSDPFGQDVSFVDGSHNACDGSCIGFSAHSTSTVGSNFYGNTSGLASGANTVTIYEANDWLNKVLNFANSRDPIAQNFRVQNFSWIGTFENDSKDRNALQRFDFVIDRDNVTAVVGLNNNGKSTQDPNPSVAHPHFLSHSYNALAVGRSDAKHSRGVTDSFYGPGRFKPDIVAPRTVTSAATSATSGAIAILHEAVVGTAASNSETMKAIAMAGATKQEFASFVEPSTGIPNPWGRTTTQPLDDIFGAGELNVYNSYLMTVGGQTAGSTDDTGALVESVDSHGWDYQIVSPGSDRFYNFEVPAGSTATELSIILAWNAEVTDSNSGNTFSGTLQPLANLDLSLYDSTSEFMDTLLDESLSTIDNVEHIYVGPGQPMDHLGPGTYTLKVAGSSARDYGLAWRLNTLFDMVSADFDEDGDTDGQDFLAWQRGFGMLLGASHADGDSDGDGDVDADDLIAFEVVYDPPPIISAALSVPEPGTLALALLTAAGLWAIRSGRMQG